MEGYREDGGFLILGGGNSMYAGGDDYEMLAEFDPVAYNTAVDWRQPVIDWIITQESSAERPLDEAIQGLMVNHDQ